LRIVTLLIKYILGVVVGAIVSLTIAQQKFPPNFKLLTDFQRVRVDVEKSQAANYTPADGMNVEDPFEEAKQLHDKQAAAMKVLSEASGFKNDEVDSPATNKRIPTGAAPSATEPIAYKTYKTKTEMKPSSPPEKQKPIIKY
jgi:hypothetical protein